MKRFVQILLLSSVGMISQAQVTSVRDVEIAEILLKSEPYSECEHISSDSTDYYDFDGDGVEEAIFVGSSCFPGTAGPDIHSVYKLETSGSFTELPIQESTAPIPLVGNRNYTLYQREGLLVRQFRDHSGRENPLTQYYKWNGSQFQLVRTERAPYFKPSFDCGKTLTEVEITICGNEELAGLDRDMDAMYRALLRNLGSERKARLVQDQKSWLSQRNKRCNYKWVLDCLLNLYTARLEELELLQE